MEQNCSKISFVAELPFGRLNNKYGNYTSFLTLHLSIKIKVLCLPVEPTEQSGHEIYI